MHEVLCINHSPMPGRSKGCGFTFTSTNALEQHQRDTGHRGWSLVSSNAGSPEPTNREPLPTRGEPAHPLTWRDFGSQEAALDKMHQAAGNVTDEAQVLHQAAGNITDEALACRSLARTAAQRGDFAEASWWLHGGDGTENACASFVPPDETHALCAAIRTYQGQGNFTVSVKEWHDDPNGTLSLVNDFEYGCSLNWSLPRNWSVP